MADTYKVTIYEATPEHEVASTGKHAKAIDTLSVEASVTDEARRKVKDRLRELGFVVRSVNFLAQGQREMVAYVNPKRSS